MADWYVIIERMDLDLNDLPPYVVGPFPDEAAAEEEGQSDNSLTFSLLTIDAKAEGYIAHEVFWTDEPEPFEPEQHIIPN